jgi:hypothetical protein
LDRWSSAASTGSHRGRCARGRVAVAPAVRDVAKMTSKRRLGGAVMQASSIRTMSAGCTTRRTRAARSAGRAVTRRSGRTEADRPCSA